MASSATGRDGGVEEFAKFPGGGPVWGRGLVRFLHRGEKLVGLQLLHVELGFFALTGPDDGAAELVDFHHESLGLCLRVAEDPFQDEGHEAHQIHRIVVDDDIPRAVETGLGFRFGDGDFFDVGCHRVGAGSDGPEVRAAFGDTAAGSFVAISLQGNRDVGQGGPKDGENLGGAAGAITVSVPAAVVRQSALKLEPGVGAQRGPEGEVIKGALQGEKGRGVAGGVAARDPVDEALPLPIGTHLGFAFDERLRDFQAAGTERVGEDTVEPGVGRRDLFQAKGGGALVDFDEGPREVGDKPILEPEGPGPGEVAAIVPDKSSRRLGMNAEL